ncbi:MAG: S8 family serine peptidase [Solirubrobacteraceae bacterium]|nr:S8 family serine peptidase [Solirubrobacteraceae bacterium]
MRPLALRAALVALTFLAAVPVAAAASAVRHDERPMLLPATEGPGAAAASASSQPATWLVAAEPGRAQAAATARRFGAQKLRTGVVYRVATVRARAFAAALRADGALRYAEPDTAMKHASALDAQPGGYARGLVVEPGIAPPAPGAATIAVVDQQVDVTHPDLAGHTTVLNPGPLLGPHGTMVASAATGALNGSGVFGIFPSNPVLSVGLPLDLRCSDAANAVVAAANARARVINLSFGSPQPCTTLYAAVQIAFARGSLVVAAAGNEFAAGNPVIYPAAYPHVLSVAALNAALQPSAFSSENAAIDVAAPGVGIPLAIPTVFDDDGVADGVTLGSGTSFAAPIVSGAAAWLATVRPNLRNGQLADVLRRSARDIDPPGYDLGSGFGLIQMGAALAAPTPALDPLEPNDGISFVDGSVFTNPDRYVWTGSGRRTFSATADRLKDPVDVYRIRLPARSQARIRLRPAFGNPDLFIYRSDARSIDQSSRILARSRKAAGQTDAVTVRNTGRSARRYYVAIRVAANRGVSLSTSYRLEFQRTKFRR